MTDQYNETMPDEGDEEEVLTPDRTLPMGLGRVTLELGPRSFFQTNSAVAAGLYEQVRDWLAADRPESLLDPSPCSTSIAGSAASRCMPPPCPTHPRSSGSRRVSRRW